MTFATEHILAPIAGSVDGDYGLVDGSGQEARFHQPLDIGIDQDDQYLYVADYGNFAVRRVDIDTGDVSTLTDNLPGSPVRLLVEGGLIFVSCIAPINEDWVPPLPYTEAEITELQLATPSYDVIDAHIQDEFDTGARYPATPGDLTNVPQSLNVHPGPRQMLCFWPNGDLCWMRAHGDFGYDETFFENGVDGAFILPSGSGIVDYEAQTGYMPSWKIRSNNSGQPYGEAEYLNIKPRFGIMPGVIGYMDASYTRPDSERNHCYNTGGSCNCYPDGWPDHLYHVHDEVGAWQCVLWGDPFMGDWDSGTSYNHLESVSKPSDPDTYYWFGSAYSSTVGVDPVSVDSNGTWVVDPVAGTPAAWDNLTSYSDGAHVTFSSQEYVWVGNRRTSTVGQEPDVDVDPNGVWVTECRCATLPIDLHFASLPSDLTHSYWQDMSADQDWCDAYNGGSRWVPYNTMDFACSDIGGFYEPGLKSSECGSTTEFPLSPCLPDLCRECPGYFTYSEGNNDYDGAFASDCGLLHDNGFHVGFLGYVYPSNQGLTTQHSDYTTKCKCVANSALPEEYILRSIYTHWGESLSDSTVEWDREFLTRTWGDNGSAGWQMAWGPAGSTYDYVIGAPLYNSASGFLQTFEYQSGGQEVTDPLFWGEINPPYNTTGPNNGNGFSVRGCAYSPSRQTWYFSTSATSTYGPYTKFKAGSRNDIGYHQIVRMLPYVEVHPTGNMNLGGVVATIDVETLVTTASGIVWNDVNRDGIYTAGEPLLEGIDIISYDMDHNVRDTATTDVNGEYTVEVSYPVGRIEIDSSTWPEGLTEQVPPYRAITVEALEDNGANFSLREPRVSDVMPSAGNFLPMHVN